MADRRREPRTGPFCHSHLVMCVTARAPLSLSPWRWAWTGRAHGVGRERWASSPLPPLLCFWAPFSLFGPTSLKQCICGMSGLQLQWNAFEKKDLFWGAAVRYTEITQIPNFTTVFDAQCSAVELTPLQNTSSLQGETSCPSNTSSPPLPQPHMVRRSTETPGAETNCGG